MVALHQDFYIEVKIVTQKWKTTVFTDEFHSKLRLIQPRYRRRVQRTRVAAGDMNRSIEISTAHLQPIAELCCCNSQLNAL